MAASTEILGGLREEDCGAYVRLTYRDAFVPILAWVKGVAFEPEAKCQAVSVALLPCAYKQVVILPDVHVGIGAAVGTVVATRDAIIPAAVGVDIGCGIRAVRLSLSVEDLPADLRMVRAALEAAVPHGRTEHGQRGDLGAWRDDVPPDIVALYESELQPRYQWLCAKHPGLEHPRPAGQLGTLGTGNHFIELCSDEIGRIWLMLHSGSRGPGNAIGQYFTALAGRQAKAMGYAAWLPEPRLAFFTVESPAFLDYVEALEWAQRYASFNRALMMGHLIAALRAIEPLAAFAVEETIDCHHNYAAREHHFGKELWITRKGAVRAGDGDIGIVAGSMGTPSYIVRGKGERESFSSCSHGAGRVMSRRRARETFTIGDHMRETEGVECRKDAEVIDETPMAYKDVHAVMAAQNDLATVVHTLRQHVCVKG